eukprot:Phypoly_transcript_09699.p1 GENE.Phypoly_transcript_09699~~Phypoly_transcript_09699.p1  ORF type:complete len:430 (+),score=69.94 Phypoly_transcript_09699:84-1373(+)
MNPLIALAGALVIFTLTTFTAITWVMSDRQQASANVADQLAYISTQLFHLQNTTNTIKSQDFQKLLSAIQETNNNNGRDSDTQKLLAAIQNININKDNKETADLLSDIQKKITSLSKQPPPPSNVKVEFKKLSSKEKENALALIDKQLELKRASHEAQKAATKKYRDRCVAMEEPKLNSLNAWLPQHNILWWMYENTYQCSVDQRMGINGDGGKWICNPDVIASKPCILYSFGVKDDFSFETEVNQRLGCPGRLYDPTIDVVPVQQQLDSLKDVKIARVGADDNDNSPDYKRLHTLMAQNGHDYIDVLKIDIEGAEQRFFKDFFKTHNEKMQKLHPGSKPGDYPVATIILLEIHYGNDDMWPKTKAQANFGVLNTWIEFFQLVEDQGYAIYHKEMNLYNLGGAEYAFVHLSTMENLEREYMSSFLTDYK